MKNKKEELEIKKEIMTRVQYKLNGDLILRYVPKDGKKYFEHYSHLPTKVDMVGNVSSKEIELKTEQYELRSAMYQFRLYDEILDDLIHNFNYARGDEINYFMKFCNPENLIKKVKIVKKVKKEVCIIKYEEKYYKKNKKNKRKQEKLMKKINNLKLKAEILKKKYKKVELN